MSHCNSDPLLSVVIAHKNRNAQLLRSLQTWRRQKGRNGHSLFHPDDLEIVVVDDGSSNPPIHECKDYGASLVLLPHQDRKNPSVAWNAGLRTANGCVLACTHAEVLPGLDVARYLLGACIGDVAMLGGLKVWAPAPTSPGWDKGVIEKEIAETVDINRMGGCAIRANVTVMRLTQDHSNSIGSDPAGILGAPDFWTYVTDFGGHTNHEIVYRFRGFFWNNLFAMRSDVWDWMNYFRASRDWGMDDEDSQRRNLLLKLPYVFTDSTFGYHQHHGPEFRGGSDDHYEFQSLADARLLHLYPETPERKLDLERGTFWKQ